MADTKKSFDLESLKTDSRLWKRLATPVGRGRTLGNVFNEKENPFEKDGYAAMEMAKKLAAEGKLFVREDGRSRHYRKVEMDGEKMKLGDTIEARTDLGGDIVYSGLIRASRAYFKWLGWESLSNWFDKRVQNYDAVQSRKNTYKEEYKNLSPEQKKEMKKLRKQEKQEAKARKKLRKQEAKARKELRKQEKEEAKARKKLEAMEKKTAKARKDLDKVLGQDGKTKGEMETPLNQPTDVEKDKGSMQPVTLGDDLKNEKKDEPVTPETTPTSKPEEKKKEETKQEETKQEEKQTQTVPGTVTDPKPEEPKKSDFSLTVGGKEYTKENIQEAPENVRRVLELLEAIAKQLDTMAQPQKTEQPTKNAFQIQDGPKVEVPSQTTERKPNDFQIQDGPKVEVPAQTKEAKPNAFQVEEGPKVEAGPKVEEPAVKEEVPVMDGETPTTEMNAPLNDPPKVEKDKSPIQNRAPEEGTLPERLAEEKMRMDSVKNWKEHMTHVLFSHNEGRDLLEMYDAIKDVPEVSSDFLTLSTFGLLAKAGPENREDIMEAILQGVSLGNDYDLYIRAGVNHARDVSNNNVLGNSEDLKKLLTDTVLDLSVMASKEPELSERHVMIGRLISNAMEIAESNEISLPLDHQEKAAVKGAVTLAKVATRYLDARQELGKGPVDMTTEKGASAVRDLLLGNAVNTMIKQDHLDKVDQAEINTCQVLMGTDIWSEEKLMQMTNNSKFRRAIEPHQVQKILERPNSSLAHKAAKSVNDEIILETQENYKELMLTNERAPERDVATVAMNPM